MQIVVRPLTIPKCSLPTSNQTLGSRSQQTNGQEKFSNAITGTDTNAYIFHKIYIVKIRRMDIVNINSKLIAILKQFYDHYSTTFRL